MGLKINSIQIEQNFDFGNVSLGGKDNTISGNSTYSTILAGQNNTIGTHSYNSVILGGSGLELDNENNVVLVPTLKIATASNVSADRILVWDTDNYVKYREVSTISGGGGSVAINTDEVGFGTGTGLTSSGNFKFNTTCNNLIASKGGEITNSENSVILGGECYSGTPYFGQSGGNQIIGGKNNLVTGGFYCNNGTIYNFPNKIYNSISSTILGGRGNTLGTSSNSSIIGGRCNTLSYYSFNSSIINGFCNTLSNSSSYSSIINGFCNTLSQLSNYSSIVGGYKNTLCSSYKSSIIGGKSNTLTCFSYYSSIIGGQGNTMSCYSCNSVIIGGIGLTLSNECSVVYVPQLKIATASNVSASKVLVWDDNNYVGYRELSSIVSGTFSGTFSVSDGRTSVVDNGQIKDIFYYGEIGYTGSPISEGTINVGLSGVTIRDYYDNGVDKVTFKTDTLFTVIDDGFTGNTFITSVILHGATGIGIQSFIGCTSLTSIDLPQAQTIGDASFYDCTSLDEVKIPKCVTLGTNNGDNVVFSGCASGLEVITNISLNTDGDLFYVVNILSGTVIYVNPYDFVYGVFSGTFSVSGGRTSVVDNGQIKDIFYYGEIGYTGSPISKATINLGLSVVIRDYYDNGVDKITFKTDLPFTVIDNGFAGNTSITSLILHGATGTGDSSFSGCTSLTTIDLPQVITIGDSSFFNCNNLTTIDLPQVQTTGEYSFVSVPLTTLDLPLVQTIGDFSFQGCSSLNSIDLPQVQTIGAGSFQFCTLLGTASLPEVQTIGGQSFNDCVSITTIDLPQAQTIGDNSFNGCTLLISVKIPKCVTLGTDPTDNSVFLNCSSSLEVLTNILLKTSDSGNPDGDLQYVINTLSGTVLYINDYAFVTDGISLPLNEIVFGSGTGLTSSPQFQISTYAYAINTLSNSNSSSIIGGFDSVICSSNRASIIGGSNNNINLSEGSIILGGKYLNMFDYSRYSSIIGGFCNTIATQSCRSSIIGGGSNTISHSSCYSSIIGGQTNTLSYSSCNSSIIGGKSNTLSSASCYSSIIGGSYNCLDNSCNSAIIGGIGLTLSSECSVVLVPTLKIATASNVSASRVLVWDDNNYVGYRELSSIVSGTFSGTFSVSDGRTSVVDNGQIKDIYYYGEIGYTGTAIDESTINSGLSGVTIRDYFDDTVNSKVTFKTDLPFTVINSGFESNTSITNLVLHGATGIGNNSFKDCTNLTTIDLPKVTSIGDLSFKNCPPLITVSLTQVTSIGVQSFISCTSLTTVYLPLVQTLGDYSFCNCPSLTTVYLPLVQTIGDNSFDSCTLLPTIDLPLVTSIGDYSFYNCTQLTAVDLPKVITIGTDSFYGCTLLNTINLPLVQTIGNQSFYNCTSLTTIDLPEVQTLGDSSFYGCTSLIFVEIPKCITLGTTTGNDYVFFGCASGLEVITSIIHKTSNSGNPDGDLVYVTTIYGGLSGTVIYINIQNALPADQVAIGTGPSITSSSEFRFKPSGGGLSESNLIIGQSSTVSSSCGSSIISRDGCISDTFFGGIFSGRGNKIDGSDCSSIIGGSNNYNISAPEGSIIGGHCNLISYSNCSSILGGKSNTIISNIYSPTSGETYLSSIVGGEYNTICLCSNRNSIIGGLNNEISASENSVIIGGNNLTLSSENNVVYVPTLKIATASVCNTVDKILVWDDNNYVGYREVSSISSGVSVNTQTVLSYTMSLVDAGSTLIMDNSIAQNIIIDTYANVAFVAGTKIDVVQIGSGTVSFSAEPGVTLNSKNSYTRIANQYSAATLLNISSDNWVLIGNLTS